MTKKRIEFPFAYRLVFVPRRGRSERSLILKDSVFVDVPEISYADAPVVFDLRVEGKIPQPRYDVGGVLYRDVYNVFRPEDPTLDRTKKLLYSAEGAPWPDHINENRGTDRPTMIDRLVLDDHDAVRQEVLEKAGRIRIRDGVFIHPEGPPAMRFWATPGTALFVSDIEFSPTNRGYRFPVNRFSEAMDEFQPALAANDFGHTSHIRGFTVLGDESRMALDCRAHNASFASTHLRHHLGKRFDSASPDHLLKVADLVELGDGVRNDVSLLPNLKRVVTEIAEMFSTTKSPVRRHAAIGLAAIEMAERFHSEDLLGKPVARIGR